MKTSNKLPTPNAFLKSPVVPNEALMGLQGNMRTEVPPEMEEGSASAAKGRAEQLKDIREMLEFNLSNAKEMQKRHHGQKHQPKTFKNRGSGATQCKEYTHLAPFSKVR
jgi:hypothetical protein